MCKTSCHGAEARSRGKKTQPGHVCTFLVTCRWHDISCRLSNFPIVTLTICVTRVIILPTTLSTNCDTWHCYFYFNVQYFDLILHSTPIPSFSLQIFLFSVEVYVTCHEGAETSSRHQWSITWLHLFLCADTRSYTLQSVSHWCLHHQLPWLQHHTQTQELGAKYRNHSRHHCKGNYTAVKMLTPGYFLHTWPPGDWQHQPLTGKQLFVHLLFLCYKTNFQLLYQPWQQQQKMSNK